MINIQTNTAGQYAADAAKIIGHPIDGGAIWDLQMGDFKIMGTKATNIPCFAIAGSVLPDDPLRAGLMGFLYNFCKNYSEYVGGPLGEELGKGISFVDFIGELFGGQDSDLVVSTPSSFGGFPSV